jgi:fructose-1,6-bisphosphatase
MENYNQIIQELIGEVPDKIGSIFGVEITQDLNKKTLFSIIHWLIEDGKITKKRHDEQIEFFKNCIAKGYSI